MGQAYSGYHLDLSQVTYRVPLELVTRVNGAYNDGSTTYKFINICMKLFVNGCSFTHGAEIIENECLDNGDPIPRFFNPAHELFREQNVYAYHLHKKLKTTDLVNLSEGASSNTRIVRTTLDFFIDRLNRGLPVDDYIAVIQWTGTGRFELCEDNDHWISVFPGGVVPAQTPERVAILQQRMLEHPQNFKLEWQRQLICLSSFFNQHNIKYLFATISTFATDDSFELPEGYYRNSINWLGTDTASNRVLEDIRLTYPWRHPNLEGHKVIADRMYKRLQEIYNF